MFGYLVRCTCFQRTIQVCRLGPFRHSNGRRRSYSNPIHRQFFRCFDRPFLSIFANTSPPRHGQRLVDFAQRTAPGIEGQFMQWAGEQSKPVQFLETAEQVAAALESAPLSEVYRGLELLASDLSVPQRSLEAMYSAWLRSDLPALFNVATQSPLFHFTGLRAAVLERRNREWALGLSELMESPTRTLVAVGALHLHGVGNAFEYVGRSVRVIPQRD